MPKKQPLSETHPELARDADGWDASTVTQGSHKKMPWVCSLGHRWDAVISSRAQGRGCPSCGGRQAIPGVSDLATVEPMLALWADGWDPTKYKTGSETVQRWMCPEGHSFTRSIANHVKSKKCPICSGHTVIPGVNDLASTHPQIASELQNIDPSTIKPQSNKLGIWRCQKGHEFQTTIYTRVKNVNGGCPICSNKKIQIGFNDLASTHPDLAQEADGWDPKEVVAGSNKKLPWWCHLGHLWSAVVYTRTIQKTGCPVCSGKKVLVGFNDLATTHPDLAKELVDLDPTTVTRGTPRIATFKGACGHIFRTSIAARTGNRKSGCPVCAGKQIEIGFNDLATTHPHLAKELATEDATKFSKGSSKKVEWICPIGHYYFSSIANRVMGKGCPYCANIKVLPGYNDLESQYPDIASKILDLDPSTITAFSKVVAKWKCDFGHITASPVYMKHKTDCPVCSNQQVLKGFNDLATTHPDVASWAHGWDPTSVSAGSDKKRNWICTAGHVFDRIVGEQSRFKSCPVCSNHRVLSGFNDLATKFPELVIEADGWDPTRVLPASHKKVKWKCSKGHTWISVIKSRTLVGAGCPYCSNREVLPGFNDLGTTHPKLAGEAFGWDPKEVIAGTHKKLSWICEKEHVWSAAVKSRALQGVGCPSCSQKGFDPEMPAHIYLLRHESQAWLQIGISNNLPARLKKHMRGGWKVIDTRGPMRGYTAFEIEQLILRYLDIMKIPRGKSAFDKSFDGYTESWHANNFDVHSIYNLTRLIDEQIDESAPLS